MTVLALDAGARYRDDGFTEGSMVLKVEVTTANQRALVLDSEVLHALGADGIDEYEVTKNGDVIELRPLRDRKAHVRALAEQAMSQHDETFRRLSQ